jgi:hydrogenase expression/formation protein HypD
MDEFRDAELVKQLLQQLDHEVRENRSYRLMEFCGGHTHALYRYGLISLLPDMIRMVHGPGCPVCVLPAGRIDAAIRLAERSGVILCSYGDMMRVPGSCGDSLIKARARAADVRMVYSPLDAVSLAQENPERHIVFFAVGFETTMPATALALLRARQEGIDNFSAFSNHLLTPPAMRAILDGERYIDGIIGPGHVSVVTGSEVYGFAADEFAIPLVISGFEPIDLLESILMLVRQINAGEARIENQYKRAVLPQGNEKAQKLLQQVFDVRDSSDWRGLGALPHSGCKIADAFAEMDVEAQNLVESKEGEEFRACKCPEVLRGKLQPESCPLFGSHCTPENPLGACMVSSEGACAAVYHFGQGEGVTA